MSLKAGLNPGLFFWLVGQLQIITYMNKSLFLFVVFFAHTAAYARINATDLLQVPGIVRVERFEPAKADKNHEKHDYFSIAYKVGRREFSALIAYPRHFYQRIPAVIFAAGDELLPSLLPEINTDIFSGNGTRLLVFSQTRGVEKDMAALVKLIRKLPLVDTKHVVLASASRPALTSLSCEESLRAEFDDWIWNRMMRGL